MRVWDVSIRNPVFISMIMLALVVLGVGIRALTAAFSRQRVYDALWMPVSTILMAIIATQAISWRLRHGGPQWSGRTLVKQPEPARRKG